MATVDRVHRGYPAWMPSATDFLTEAGQYVGKHRKHETKFEALRIRSLFRLFYVAQHRAR